MFGVFHVVGLFSLAFLTDVLESIAIAMCTYSNCINSHFFKQLLANVIGEYFD